MTDKDIKVYSTPRCPWCIKAKDYLKEKNVEFTELNVAEDRAKLEEMMEISGQRGVPVLSIGDKVVIGFNQTKIDEALAA